VRKRSLREGKKGEEQGEETSFWLTLGVFVFLFIRDLNGLIFQRKDFLDLTLHDFFTFKSVFGLKYKIKGESLRFSFLGNKRIMVVSSLHNHFGLFFL